MAYSGGMPAFRSSTVREELPAELKYTQHAIDISTGLVPGPRRLLQPRYYHVQLSGHDIVRDNGQVVTRRDWTGYTQGPLLDSGRGQVIWATMPRGIAVMSPKASSNHVFILDGRD